MKISKIVFYGWDKSPLDPKYTTELSKIANLEYIPKDDKKLFEKTKDVDAIISRFHFKIDKELIDNCKKLKYINVFATDFSTVDINYARKKGITVTNLAGYSTEAVAEFIFATLLENIREIERGKSDAKNGEFDCMKYLGWEIKDSKFAIIGLGDIGKRVSEIALGFGADVRYWSRNRKKDYEKKGVNYMALNKIVDSDIISVNLAKNDETESILNKKVLDNVKEGAIFLLTTSFELMDTNYFIKLLKKNKFAVLSDYGSHLSEKQRKELSKLKNVIFYPAIAWRTKETLINRQKMVIENLVKFLEGKPQNVVN
jgi:lactate dehydrogenase-like 2-hydroxyacid dehydrogenase